MKINKLNFAAHFLAHVLVYFFTQVTFSPAYLLFWFSLALYLVTVICSLYFEKSERLMQLFEKLHHKKDWASRLDVFDLTK